MEPAEAYHKHDNWPPEVERALMIRIASEVPVLQDTLLRVLLIGISKVGMAVWKSRSLGGMCLPSFVIHSHVTHLVLLFQSISCILFLRALSRMVDHWQEL